MERLTRAEYAVLAAWLDTDPLPEPPFRSAPWLEMHDTPRCLPQLRWALRQGPRERPIEFHKATQELCWLAYRYGTPEAKAAAHADALVIPPRFGGHG